MKKILHACILSGGSAAALEEKAYAMAADALCERGGERACGQCRHCRKIREHIHPDVTLIQRELNREGKLRKEIVVDQIRRMDADAAVLPNEAERKVYILREAELLNTEGQNAFLKLLEEPPEWVLFLLCAENAARLLPTIRSRCAQVTVGGEKRVDDVARGRAEAYIAALDSDAELLRCCAKLEKLDTAELRSFVEAARLCAVELLPPGKELLALEEELRRAAEYLRQNVSVKHVLGMLSTYEMRNDR
ncbi:MAG: hypothetical protein IJE26_00160 [Oscillospiraceae bacterium]|nr:hypothetical protein [Oscillospiraceae bacterium]